MLLESNYDGWTILDEVESTNTYLLNSAAAAGAVVFARSQTRGRGRQGRSWSARPGDSVIFSGLLEFAGGFSGERLRFLPLLAGAAVLRAATADRSDEQKRAGDESDAREDLQVKWPNDVYLRRQGRIGKVAGVLVESTVRAGRFRAVLGVGLNYRGPAPVVDAAPVPPAVLFSEQTLGDPIRRFGPRLVNAINELLPELYSDSREPPAFLRELRERNYLKDRVVSKNGRTFRAIDIADDGRLILED
ncbi:MAG: hypothetical protein RIF32_18990, partial [Leptospirales bacterium]